MCTVCEDRCFSRKRWGFMLLFLIVSLLSTQNWGYLWWWHQYFCQHHHHHQLSSPHTHKIITLSIMQPSLPTVRRMCGWVWDWAQKRAASRVWGGLDECGAQPCLDPGKSEMRDGMVGDKSTSGNSMGHFSKGAALTPSTVCLPVRTERERDFDIKFNLDQDS